MSYLPVDTIIEVAKISQYLASADERSRHFYKNQVVDKRLHRLLYMERKALEWMYLYNPNDTTLSGPANYVFALCAPYANKALQILNEGNAGGVIVNPSTGTASAIVAYLDQFEIGDPDSPMAPGETVLVIPLSGFLVNSVNVFLDGVDLSIGRTDRIAYNIDYSNPAQITITFNSPVAAPQVYDIQGLRYQAVVPPSANTSETFRTVATYADMLAQATGDFYISFLVVDDEESGQSEQTYEYRPGQGIFWMAGVEKVNLGS